MLAYGVFDIYMTGIFHAKEPIDLSRGHHQTLVGYTQFEVIQEHYIAEVTQIYDFLFDYISRKHNDRLPVYVTSLQKWADQFIKNGVSFNNWNIFQASHVARIALVLENNSAYENGKGAQYYLDQIMNQTSTRQWSMIKLLEYGYEQETGIWNESPGYSLGVLRDLVHLIKFYDHSFGIDLIEKLPVLKKAVLSSAQYLNPNLTRITFGDGHYGKLDPGPVLYMIENAQKYGRMEDEIIFTKMLKTLFDDSEYRASKGKKIDDLFQEKPLKVREDIVAGKLSDFTSPLFYAPNVSWLVQRQGELMISQIGSMGNHMHSNGIAMQLYGYGLPLAPEPGHGSSYFSIEYGEYYTQFPAHNTVIVNGKSKYPEMKSNHAFTLNASYPKSGVQNGIFPRMTFSDVSFLEPETHSDQRRVMGIVTDVEGGYYIDIFRSKQKEGKDVKHEYCYHNLGQSLELKDEDGNILPMNPTTKMAFGDGDLMAYDYMWEKKSIESSNNFTGQFNLHLQDKAVSMNLWSRGEKNREIFTALSPKATSLAHGILPDKLQELPIPTVVIRQNGEAWSNPFVLVYEPALNGTSNIMRVDYFGDEVYTGIHIVNKSGREEFIFSSPVKIQMKKDDKIVEGSYAIVSIQGNDVTLFLGNGKSIANSGYRVESEKAGHFAFEKRGDVYVLLAQHPITLTIPVENLYNSYMMTIAGKAYKGVVNKKTKAVRFDLPAVEYQNVNFVTQAR
jgi:hypothetical protein